MPLTADQIRSAFAKLNGQRDVRIRFDYGETCIIAGAFLVPAEADNILKFTDGTREFLVDAERIIWVEIG
jgi:hypothetical protein